MTRWNEFYREDERVLSAPPTACVHRAAELFLEHSCRSILDPGCGVGRDAFYLSDKGLFVVGADLSESGLAIASSLRRQRTARPVFVKADARSLPFLDESFQGVYCFGLLHEFTGETRDEDIRLVTREAYRVLEADGVLVLAVLSGKPQEGLPHVYLHTEQMFDAATSAFELLEKREYLDVGCTGKQDYRIWYGAFTKQARLTKGSM